MSICLCVQLKGGPHVGHLLQSTGHGILLTFISMNRFNNVPSIAMFMTVNMIMHPDMYTIHIYVTQVKYTINDHIIFNIEVVALRGRTSADV